MFIMWRQFDCTASGSVIKSVTCENCGKRYFYEMFRQVLGQGTSMYGGVDEYAKKTARTSAEANLKKRLETDVDPVPCIKCGWYQSAMKHKLQRQRAPWLLTAALGAFIFAMLFGSFGIVADDPRIAEPSLLLLLPVAGFCAVACSAFAIARKIVQWTFDPNSAPLEERLAIARKSAIAVD